LKSRIRDARKFDIPDYYNVSVEVLRRGGAAKAKTINTGSKCRLPMRLVSRGIYLTGLTELRAYVSAARRYKNWILRGIALT
jgi:hypothetical protein